MSQLTVGAEVHMEYEGGWVIVCESQRISIIGDIPSGKYIVLEDLGKRVTLLPKEGGVKPVTTYKL